MKAQEIVISKIYTQFDRPPIEMEKNDEPSMTETAGYITPQQMVENLINAGQRLDAYRMEQYDFQDYDENGYLKIDNEFHDPTRSKNFDDADATQIALNLNAKLAVDKKAVDAKIREKKEKELTNAPELPGLVPEKDLKK
nr:MAG: hypothetical protein [Microviridae sp.]